MPVNILPLTVAKLLFEYTIDELVAKFNKADIGAAAACASYGASVGLEGLIASAINDSRLPADKAASIFDNSNLAVDKAALISDNRNLAEAKLQAIFDNPNLSIQKGQEIVDAMSNPSKIGTGGRRGIIGDDWEDNKLTTRDKAAIVATTLSRISQKFRPEWDTTNANTKISVESGHIKIVASTDYNKYIKITDNIAEGTWKIKQRLGAVNAASGYNHTLSFMFIDTDNFYSAYISGFDDYVRFDKFVTGSITHLIAGSITRNTNWHEVKITRDADGNFELFYDGTSKGTTTDTSHSSGDLVIGQLREENDEDVYVDDLEVY